MQYHRCLPNILARASRKHWRLMLGRWPRNGRNKPTSFGGLTRSQLMSRVHSTGNKTTELRMASLLRKAGITGWRRHVPILGRPDFTFPKSRIVLFVDGCFWHGHNCGKNVRPRTNAMAWQEKLENNKRRDRRVTRQLQREGWCVLRVWECKLAEHPNICLQRIKRALLQRSTAAS